MVAIVPVKSSSGAAAATVGDRHRRCDPASRERKAGRARSASQVRRARLGVRGHAFARVRQRQRRSSRIVRSPRSTAFHARYAVDLAPPSRSRAPRDLVRGLVWFGRSICMHRHCDALCTARAKPDARLHPAFLLLTSRREKHFCRPRSAVATWPASASDPVEARASPDKARLSRIHPCAAPKPRSTCRVPNGALQAF